MYKPAEFVPIIEARTARITELEAINAALLEALEAMLDLPILPNHPRDAVPARKKAVRAIAQAKGEA